MERPAGRQVTDLARLLPDDVLADVLRRVALRGLAVSRCVCRAWRALIDERRMLLHQHLLPHSLAGLFINYQTLPYLFARPTTDVGELHLPRSTIHNHCNGLLLHYDEGVLNPATGGWTPLPELPPPCRGMDRAMYLAFDPAVSPHYEVFAIPIVPYRYGEGNKNNSDKYPCDSEWPPSPFNLSVFSSRTGRWDERPFIRENEAAGTVADMESDARCITDAACWRGALYVRFETDFTTRISLSNDTYRVIKPPRAFNAAIYEKLHHMGKSEKGIYFAQLEDEDFRLRVWILDEESHGQTNWILQHDSGRGLAMPSLNCNMQACGPWILTSHPNKPVASNDAQLEPEFEWDSDGEDILDAAGTRNYPHVGIEILAFHPFKEVVFLHRSKYRGLAYHLNNSKLEDLGFWDPPAPFVTGYEPCGIQGAFPYTPCFMGDFSQIFDESLLDD